MRGLSQARFFAGLLAHFEHHLAEVERLASDFTELSRRNALPKLMENMVNLFDY